MNRRRSAEPQGSCLVATASIGQGARGRHAFRALGADVVRIDLVAGTNWKFTCMKDEDLSARCQGSGQKMSNAMLEHMMTVEDSLNGKNLRGIELQTCKVFNFSSCAHV